jgi:hypothetical protein
MILRRLKTKFYKWTERKIKADIDRTIPLIRPGTEYGGLRSVSRWCWGGRFF